MYQIRATNPPAIARNSTTQITMTTLKAMANGFWG